MCLSHRSRLIPWLFMACWAPLVQASDTISSSVFGTRYDAYGWTGYGGSLGYQHASDVGGVIVALNDTEYPIGSLKVLDLDGYRHEWDHVWLSAGGSIGDAAIMGSPSSTLYKTRLAVDTQFDPQWLTHLADQFIELGQIRGHLMTTGVEYRPIPQWGVNLSGGYSLSGTLGDHYGLLAVNWYGVEHFYGGIVLGRNAYDIARLGVVQSAAREFQAYAGAALPLGSAPRHATLTIDMDTLSVEGLARQTLRLGFKKPINP